MAARFGYTPGSFRVLCHHFRADPTRKFFLPERVRQTSPDRPATKTARLRDKVVALRKRNLSVYDIAAVLAEAGEGLSPPAIWAILSEEGFARLPRRADEERAPKVGPTPAAVADVRAVDLTARQFRTDYGGLFLFLPTVAHVGFDALMAKVSRLGTARPGPADDRTHCTPGSGAPPDAHHIPGTRTPRSPHQPRRSPCSAPRPLAPTRAVTQEQRCAPSSHHPSAS